MFPLHGVKLCEQAPFLADLNHWTLGSPAWNAPWPLLIVFLRLLLSVPSSHVCEMAPLSCHPFDLVPSTEPKRGSPDADQTRKTGRLPRQLYGLCSEHLSPPGSHAPYLSPYPSTEPGVEWGPGVVCYLKSVEISEVCTRGGTVTRRN